MFKFITTLVLTLASAAAFAAVDLNKADQAALETVKGIGPALSTKLLDERKKGSFKDWSDVIERVGGVGPGNAARLSAAGLTVGDKAYTAAAPGTEGFTAKVPKNAGDKASGKASDKASTPSTGKTAAASAKAEDRKALAAERKAMRAERKAQAAERRAQKEAAAAEGKSPRRSAKAKTQPAAPAAASTGPALR
jgi:competence protein ComEA